MSENPNQVATVDLRELQEHVKSREFTQKIQGTEQEDRLEEHTYRELSNLTTTAYIPSLADLTTLQKELDQALEDGDVEKIKGMQTKYDKLRKTCFDDLCTWCKSTFYKDVYTALKQSENQNWDERIKIYKTQILTLKNNRYINPAFNENLIVPAMELANKQIDVIQQVNNLAELKDSISALKKNYDSEVNILKQAQENQTKKDMERDGMVIRSTFMREGNQQTEYIRVKGEKFLKNGLKDTFQDNLESLGLSQAQIDFIACHSNQSGITGVAPIVMPTPHVCSNLLLDIKQQPGGQSPKVSLISVGYNNVRYLKDPEKMKYLGIGYLSIDISSLGDQKEYVPGIYKDVVMKLSSDFFYNKQAQSINGTDCSIPSKLLHNIDTKEFDKNYKDFGESYLKNLDNEKALKNMDAIKDSPESLQHYIAAKLFIGANKTFDKAFYSEICNKPYVTKEVLQGGINQAIASGLFRSDNTLDIAFYQQVCNNPDVKRYVNQETLDQAVADGMVNNASKIISSELEKIKRDPNNPILDSKNREQITDKVYQSLGKLFSSESKAELRSIVSNLVLDIASNQKSNMDWRQTLKLYAGKFMDLITFDRRPQKLKLSQKIMKQRARNKFNPKYRSL